MSDNKVALVAKRLERPFGIKPEIARIRTDISSNKPRYFKRSGVGIFDGGDVVGFDLELTLNIEQRLTHRCPLASHNVAQQQIKVIEAFQARRLLLI